MAEIKNSESDMSTQQKAELDKEKRKEENIKADPSISNDAEDDGMNPMELLEIWDKEEKSKEKNWNE